MGQPKQTTTTNRTSHGDEVQAMVQEVLGRINADPESIKPENIKQETTTTDPQTTTSIGLNGEKIIKTKTKTSTKATYGTKATISGAEAHAKMKEMLGGIDQSSENALTETTLKTGPNGEKIIKTVTSNTGLNGEKITRKNTTTSTESVKTTVAGNEVGELHPGATLDDMVNARIPSGAREVRNLITGELIKEQLKPAKGLGGLNKEEQDAVFSVQRNDPAVPAGNLDSMQPDFAALKSNHVAPGAISKKGRPKRTFTQSVFVFILGVGKHLLLRR